MVVLVGCLYWSNSRAKEDLGHWKQEHANKAVANTVRWLKEHNYRNVFVDVDNEGIERVVDTALESACDGTDGVYVSLDIDVVDPVYCPAQKYPEPAGLTSKQIIAALRAYPAGPVCKE